MVSVWLSMVYAIWNLFCDCFVIVLWYFFFIILWCSLVILLWFSCDFFVIFVIFLWFFCDSFLIVPLWCFLILLWLFCDTSRTFVIPWWLWAYCYVDNYRWIFYESWISLRWAQVGLEWVQSESRWVRVDPAVGIDFLMS